MAKNIPASAADEAVKKENEAQEGDSGESGQTGSGGSVYIFANLPNGQSFKLDNGHTVTLRGYSVNRLKNGEGYVFTGGRYAVTQVPAEAWEQIRKTYGQMKIFKNGLVFTAPSLERGKSMARERGGLRHGCEPADPRSERAKTRPKTED